MRTTAILAAAFLAVSTLPVATAVTCNLDGSLQTLDRKRAVFIELMGMPDNPRVIPSAHALGDAFGAYHNCLSFWTPAIATIMQLSPQQRAAAHARRAPH